MALAFESLIGDTLISIVGNPIFAGLLLLGFFLVIFVFGRVGLIAGTPVMVGVFLLFGQIVPQFQIPFGVVVGVIVGYAFIRLYTSGRQ